MTLPSFPKVFNLGHAAIANLLLDTVIVEEKIDGSQFSFGIREIDGVLECRSRGQQVNVEAPSAQFKPAVDTFKKLAKKLIPGWVYRCEYLQKPKHNTLAYDRIPKDHLIIFDINFGLESYLGYAEKCREAKRIDLEVVPLLFEGRLNDYFSFEKLLEATSVLGGQQIEGVVIKNYQRFGKDGHVLMGKHVRESYKEIHKGDWRLRNPTGGDIIDNLIKELRTPARWEKAIQHLKEAGVLEVSPKDIGPLMKEVNADIRSECEEMIKEKLFDYAWKKISRGITAGLPEWYKSRLAQQQFDNTDLFNDPEFLGGSV